MKTLPPIGSRVRFVGSSRIGPCFGVVVRHFPSEIWTNEGEDSRPTGELAPESEWSVAIEVDEIPNPWPHTARVRRFEPAVSQLQPLDEVPR